MFRKPTSRSTKRVINHVIREPYSVRMSKKVETLQIAIPLERVHPHNLQNVKYSCDDHKDYNYDPVSAAKNQRIVTKNRDITVNEKKEAFLRKTKVRSSKDPGQSVEEIEKLKQKFRAASYTTTHGYDYGALFDKIDGDGSGSIDMSEFSVMVKRVLPEITDRQLRNLMKSADTDGSGTMERDEFIEFLNVKVTDSNPKKDDKELSRSKFETEYNETNNQKLMSSTLPTNVKCETTKGPITLAIYSEWAPIGAKRFLDLVKDGFYTDIALFRCVKKFLVQFGISDNPDMKHWHNEVIKDDADKHMGIKKHYVSFAGGGKNTRSTQMFIAFEDLNWLGVQPDGSQSWETPIGKVTEGFDVLDQLYKGYGDIAPFNKKGPDQQKIHNKGNAYIRETFPKIDFIKSCNIIDENFDLTINDNKQLNTPIKLLRIKRNNGAVHPNESNIYDSTSALSAIGFLIFAFLTLFIFNKAGKNLFSPIAEKNS